MEKLNELVELAKRATPGEWWIDSHGHTMVAFSGEAGDVEVVFATDSNMGPPVRHDDTGNLSHWRNDNDATFIAAANPDTILAIAKAFRSLEQRAEAAEAKLAELEKQPPVGEAVSIGGAIMVEWERCITDGTQLFTRPAPAINLADMLEVSANKTADEIFHLFDGIYDDRSRAWLLANAVWDACHVAILRNIEEAK